MVRSQFLRIVWRNFSPQCNIVIVFALLFICDVHFRPFSIYNQIYQHNLNDFYTVAFTEHIRKLVILSEWMGKNRNDNSRIVCKFRFVCRFNNKRFMLVAVQWIFGPIYGGVENAQKKNITVVKITINLSSWWFYFHVFKLPCSKTVSNEK